MFYITNITGSISHLEKKTYIHFVLFRLIFIILTNLCLMIQNSEKVKRLNNLTKDANLFI